jgi:hypothetical protein
MTLNDVIYTRMGGEAEVKHEYMHERRCRSRGEVEVKQSLELRD